MEFLSPLAEFGVMGLFAGFMAWLYLHERKISREVTMTLRRVFQDEVKKQQDELKLRFGYTRAIENLNQTVRVLGEESSSQMGECQMHSQKLLGEIEAFLAEGKLQKELEKAREKGRKDGIREVTGKTHLPPGGEQ